VKVFDRIRRSRSRALRWTIVTSAPKGEAGEQWGDTWFARDLADALIRAGHNATVVSRTGGAADKRADDDVVVVLRGLKAVTPPADRRAIWMLWVISHPDLVTEAEARSYDAVFAASPIWQPPGGIATTPLLQATAPGRFHPGIAEPDSGAAVLFVGSTRGEFRPAVRAALRSTQADRLRLHGVGWQDFVPTERISGEFLPNEELPAAYAGAEVVLNDHHRDMADAGFLSNRLFDAVASGARVFSDRAVGVREVFGSSVVLFDDEDHLVRLLDAPLDDLFPGQAERWANAARIADEHSFDQRAAVLIERAAHLRERTS
jgi:hypothetical protein